MSARDNDLFASSEFGAGVGAQWTCSFVGEAARLPRILNNAIAKEAGRVSCVIVGRVAQVDVGAAE